MILTIDPGFSKSNATGFAVFAGAGLIECGAYSPKAESFEARLLEITDWCWRAKARYDLTELVIELPKVYPGPQQKGDPDDIVKLATLCGAIAGRAPDGVRLRLPRPRDWKGNVPKAIMLARIEAKLHPAERAIFDGAKGKRDAILDAIGIGLWACGRL